MSEQSELTTERRLRFREALGRVARQGTAGDIVRWIVIPGSLFVIVGFCFLLFGWLGAARTAREIEQIPYLISGGLVGIALVFLGGLLIASAVWIVLLRRFSEESETRWREHTAQLEERIAELSADTNGRGTARIRPVRTAKKTAS